MKPALIRASAVLYESRIHFIRVAVPAFDSARALRVDIDAEEKMTSSQNVAVTGDVDERINNDDDVSYVTDSLLN